MTNLCYINQNVAVDTCTDCGKNICRKHSLDSYKGVLCPSCNSTELKEGLKHGIKSWGRWTLFGTILMVVVVTLATYEY
jgi:DNA-directed RNA polymerase subunit RPC12/RpoP